MIELKTISLLALVISIFSITISLFFTFFLWKKSNRPIVSAEIVVEKSGVGVASFNLVIYNSGNRPATKITLHAKKENIEKLFFKNTSTQDKKIVYDIFDSKESEIPLILNGKDTKTAFGVFSNTQKRLKMGIELPITIIYLDNEGEKFSSKLSIMTKSSYGFGGASFG
ncbi:MAG: hypothetical protein KAH77_03690 [Thiomargarita sp.]|nr:hypothetical protein [Thiomargarita sp.]